MFNGEIKGIFLRTIHISRATTIHGDSSDKNEATLVKLFIPLGNRSVISLYHVSRIDDLFSSSNLHRIVESFENFRQNIEMTKFFRPKHGEFVTKNTYTHKQNAINFSKILIS